MPSLGRFNRMVKHVWHTVVARRHPLPYEALQRLGQHVSNCERQHSGEIRLYIEPSLPWAYLKKNASSEQLCRQRAIELFSSQGIWDTAHNNGVLVYLLLSERAIEVLADRGLCQCVEATVWQALVARLSNKCRVGKVEDGLVQAVSEVSALLTQHFPLQAGELNVNELPDFPAGERS